MGTRQLTVTNNGKTSLIVVDNELFFTTAVLGANGVYNSPIFTVANGTVTYGIFANQSGSLQFETSNDGVTWYNVGSAVAVTASTFASGSVSPALAIQKFVYTNGATPQTSFTFSAYINNFQGTP
jgi:hypothetical protein